MSRPDQDFVAHIAAGIRYTGEDDLPPAYRVELTRLMVVLADSELAGAAGFAPYINRGPGLRERMIAARIVSEKYAHAGLVLKLLEHFGVDDALYVRSHAWDARLDRNIDLGTRRIGGDKRLNVFHYPLEGWEDAVSFHLLMGLATVIQLGELSDCSYRPLAEVVASILPRERDHAHFAETGIAQAIARTRSKAASQAAVDYWYRRVADTFGRSDSDNAERYIRYGLRKRGNAEMLGDWRRQSVAALERLGLRAPA